MTDEYRGILSRRKGFFSSWIKGTYVKKGHYLFEYKLGANHVSSEPLETFELDGCLIEDGHPITGKPSSFVFHSVIGKSFFFLAPSMAEKKKWMELLSLSPSSAPSAAPPSSSPAPSSAPPLGQAPVPSDAIPSYEEVGNVAGNEDLETKIPILRFLESFTDPVVVGNINGTIIAVNSAAERMFGYSKSEMKGNPLASLMPEPYKSQHDGYLFRHEKFGTEKLIGKTRNLKGERKGGDVFDLQISLGKLPVKGYYIATIREVNIQDEDPESKKKTKS